MPLAWKVQDREQDRAQLAQLIAKYVQSGDPADRAAMVQFAGATGQADALATGERAVRRALEAEQTVAKAKAIRAAVTKADKALSDAEAAKRKAMKPYDDAIHEARQQQAQAKRDAEALHLAESAIANVAQHKVAAATLDLLKKGKR